MPAGLVALALGSFGIGLTEFVIAGLLPQVGRSLAVSDAAAGWLISGYAVAVAVGAIGGVAISAGLGYTAPLFVGAVIVTIGLVTMVVAALHN